MVSCKLFTWVRDVTCSDVCLVCLCVSRVILFDKKYKLKKNEKK